MRKILGNQVVKSIAANAAWIWSMVCISLCVWYVWPHCDLWLEYFIVFSAGVAIVAITMRSVINIIRVIVEVRRKSRRRNVLTLVDMYKDTIVSYRAD